MIIFKGRSKRVLIVDQKYILFSLKIIHLTNKWSTGRKKRRKKRRKIANREQILRGTMTKNAGKFDFSATFNVNNYQF